MDYVLRPPVGCVWFETDLSPPMAVSVAFWGVEVLVGDWTVGAAPAPADGAVMPVSSVGTAGDDAGSSWWKTTWFITRAASKASALFLPTLVMGLGAVWDLNNNNNLEN